MNRNKNGTDGRRNNRPPKEHQFKPGQSGNPNGRPKGTTSFRMAIQKLLDKEITLKVNGKHETKTRLQAIAAQVINEAMKGNDKFVKFLKPYIDEIDKNINAIDDEERKQSEREISAKVGEILAQIAGEKASLAPGNYQDVLKRQELERSNEKLKEMLRRNGIDPEELS